MISLGLLFLLQPMECRHGVLDTQYCWLCEKCSRLNLRAARKAHGEVPDRKHRRAS